MVEATISPHTEYPKSVLMASKGSSTSNPTGISPRGGSMAGSPTNPCQQTKATITVSLDEPIIIIPVPAVVALSNNAFYSSLMCANFLTQDNTPAVGDFWLLMFVACESQGFRVSSAWTPVQYWLIMQERHLLHLPRVSPWGWEGGFSSQALSLAFQAIQA